MTTYERDTKALELPWPFTGRENELELIRRSLGASRHGIVVTGPAGCGKTRLVTEAVRGTDCAKAAGTPEARHIPFAAFAHLLPETVTLHKAVQLLSAVRTLLVDDAHLLDDASAALVHQLALQGRTRLLVVATDDVPVPGAVSRLWTGELLPRLTLEPLPREETDRLAAAGAGGRLEPLTVNRLHRLCGGDLRLLRDLSGALREQGLLTRTPGSDEQAWRGPLPLTATVRERTAHVIHRVDPDERETLKLLAFADPLPPTADDFDLRVLECLETDGLIDIDDHGAVRLAHPLHGPVLRATAGRLRARRLARTPDQCGPALKDEAVELARQIDEADVRTLRTPVGEWLIEEGEPVPAEYAAVRARAVRLRGELREAAAWAREGLRESPDDPSCLLELTLAAAQSGERTPAHKALTTPPASGEAATWLAAARGDIDTAVRSITGDDALAHYDAVRLGAPGQTAARLPADSPFAAHADALTRGDGPALDRAAELLQERGLLLFAAEAHAQAARSHRDPRAARTSRTRAVALTRRCQGARTPALSGLVLGELTARQRQIVTLAAAGLTNRQIADHLTLSVRTVGNHLYSAYTRLGASDRTTLPCLLDAQPA
ncbi:LuxR family transcriptional regulator [Streptomyces sp. GESEQ-4]|uniref:LuxR family transcriptional regulator AbsR2 n=1 Tax=Streptomyces sp. GESEQ-4 TaxID=2812655 RepID=UPI001B33BDF8|nr:LuxR family transcriptional regulator [Streptomyces sp. GESEQ-4]